MIGDNIFIIGGYGHVGRVICGILDRRFDIRCASVPRMVVSFENPKRAVFPGKHERRTAYLFDFADQHVVARMLDVENVAMRL